MNQHLPLALSSDSFIRQAELNPTMMNFWQVASKRHKKNVSAKLSLGITLTTALSETYKDFIGEKEKRGYSSMSSSMSM